MDKLTLAVFPSCAREKRPLWGRNAPLGRFPMPAPPQVASIQSGRERNLPNQLSFLRTLLPIRPRARARPRSFWASEYRGRGRVRRRARFKNPVLGL